MAVEIADTLRLTLEWQHYGSWSSIHLIVDYPTFVCPGTLQCYERRGVTLVHEKKTSEARLTDSIVDRIEQSWIF